MRIIEQTVRYDIVQWEYRNMPITFRYCIYNHRTTKTNQKYPSVNL